MPVCNPVELQAPPCRGDPIDSFLDLLHPSLEHALLLFETIRRQVHSSAQYLRHLRIFVPVQLGHRGHRPPPPTCTTSTSLEGQWFRTSYSHKQSPARIVLPRRLVRPPVASTVRPQMG